MASDKELQSDSFDVLQGFFKDMISIVNKHLSIQDLSVLSSVSKRFEWIKDTEVSVPISFITSQVCRMIPYTTGKIVLIELMTYMYFKQDFLSLETNNYISTVRKAHNDMEEVYNNVKKYHVSLKTYKVVCNAIYGMCGSIIH
jgi:hypothetical protein